jgi:hypothetical protein
VPGPTNPGLHSHFALPLSSVHVASGSQPPLSTAHAPGELVLESSADSVVDGAVVVASVSSDVIVVETVVAVVASVSSDVIAVVAVVDIVVASVDDEVGSLVPDVVASVSASPPESNAHATPSATRTSKDRMCTTRV